MSIMAPFFPREAAEKGLSDTLSGFVFSFYALIVFVTSPIFGKIVSFKTKTSERNFFNFFLFQLPKIGAKFLFVLGMLIAGISNILFG